MKPIIGIVARVGYPGGTHEYIVDDAYRRKVIEAGGIPIVILPVEKIDYTITKYMDTPEVSEDNKDMIINELKLCDGVILPGGFRITKDDRFILDYLIDNDIPTFGICLGMQIMSNYKKEHFYNEKNDSVINHKQEEDYVHSVKIKKDSKLYNIIGKEEIMVNSRHSYHVLPNDYFEATAYSEDGYIEALEMNDKKFMLGVQWHPESLDDEISNNLFKALIDSISIDKN